MFAQRSYLCLSSPKVLHLQERSSTADRSSRRSKLVAPTGVQLKVSSALVISGSSNARGIAEFWRAGVREGGKGGVVCFDVGGWRTMHEKGWGGWGGRWKSKHRAQKLTRECALCAVSEPEASPYCVSPRVAFVSVLVAPIVFCPHLRHPLASSSSCLLRRHLLHPALYAPFVSPPRLFRISRTSLAGETHP